MKTQVFLCLLLSSAITSCQVHWEKASDWTLYGYQGSRMFKIPLDSLNSFDTLKLNHDTVASYLATTRTLDAKDQGIWMGGYITTCEWDGKPRKIDFSNYGNFFYDEKSKTYYQLAGSKSENWNAYLQNCLLTLARRKMANAH
jgi:hypothetical protein